jgi:hypothetical protein
MIQNAEDENRKIFLYQTRQGFLDNWRECDVNQRRLGHRNSTKETTSFPSIALKFRISSSLSFFSLKMSSKLQNQDDDDIHLTSASMVVNESFKFDHRRSNFFFWLETQEQNNIASTS